MGTKYFLKEIASNVVTDRNGRPIQFQNIGGDYGVLALDDADVGLEPILTSLTALANQHMRGVVAITEGEYSAKKAAFPYNPPVQTSQSLRVFNPQRNPLSPGDNAAAANGKPDFVIGQPPVVIPTEPPPAVPAFKPRQGRLNVSAQKALDAQMTGK
jgi:hypothetical protein